MIRDDYTVNAVIRGLSQYSGGLRKLLPAPPKKPTVWSRQHDAFLDTAASMNPVGFHRKTRLAGMDKR
jgi:hypothetical protein